MCNNILEILLKNGEKYSTSVALVDDECTYSWGHVVKEVQSIATALLKLGICKANGNRPVPVLMKKSVREICTFWAIAYTGNFYVPLDEKMPNDRISLILSTLETETMICDETYGDKAREITKAVYRVEELVQSEINEMLINQTKNAIIDTDPLYTLFTSGSTGVPKGVICNHRSVISYSQWVVETFRFDSHTVMGNQTPFYFSMSILDLYSILRCGGTLIVIPKKLYMQPVKLIGYMNEKKVNTIYWVPSALSLISKLKVLEKHKVESLEKVLFAGEVMPTKQLNYWRRNAPEVLYANLFGPTEITDIGTYYIVDRVFDDEEPIPIGRACANVGILILNDELKEVKQGEVGELFFRGSFLGMGYYGDGQKTAESYIQNPLNKKYPEVVYRSGDLVKVNKQNEILYVGRKDQQIKHMGYRIEMGEIENSFNAIQGVDRVCCFLDEEKDKIVAVYTLDGKETITNKELIVQLERKLPKYMVPNVFIETETVPLNANGKIDRKLLKERYKKNDRC